MLVGYFDVPVGLQIELLRGQNKYPKITVEKVVSYCYCCTFSHVFGFFFNLPFFQEVLFNSILITMQPLIYMYLSCFLFYFIYLNSFFKIIFHICYSIYKLPLQLHLWVFTSLLWSCIVCLKSNTLFVEEEGQQVSIYVNFFF